jgi:hypothetical protein
VAFRGTSSILHGTNYLVPEEVAMKNPHDKKGQSFHHIMALCTIGNAILVQVQF